MILKKNIILLVKREDGNGKSTQMYIQKYILCHDFNKN
jgi:hypothetical protein